MNDFLQNDRDVFVYKPKLDKFKIFMAISMLILIIFASIFIGVILYVLPKVIYTIDDFNDLSKHIKESINNVTENILQNSNNITSITNISLNKFNRDIKQFADDFNTLIYVLLPLVKKIDKCVDKICTK